MWIVYAIAAAVLWGASYAMYGQILKSVSSLTIALVSALGSVGVFAIMAATQNQFAKDIATIKAHAPTLYMTLGVIVVNAIACLLVYASIKAKNATMAGMIEISYPLFTALFAWLLFKETQFNMGTLFGALMILGGIGCVYFYGKNI